MCHLYFIGAAHISLVTARPQPRWKLRETMSRFALVAVGRRRNKEYFTDRVFRDMKFRAVERGNRMVPHWTGHKSCALKLTPWKTAGQPWGSTSHPKAANSSVDAKSRRRQGLSTPCTRGVS